MAKTNFKIRQGLTIDDVEVIDNASEIHVGAIRPLSTNLKIGSGAGSAITTGVDNVMIGNSAGLLNTTGSNNVFIGKYSGAYNTTGEKNCFIGENSGLSNTTGNYNVCVGLNAGLLNTTGATNTMVGINSGLYNTIGQNNTTLGFSAGSTLTTGNNNTVIGASASASSGTVSNEITLGNGSVNRFRIPGLQASANHGDVFLYDSDAGLLVLAASDATIIETTVQTTAFTAVPSTLYICNTGGGAFTTTLPSNPVAGDVVGFTDYDGSFATNNLTITSTDDILNSASDLVLSTNFETRKLVYVDATVGWINV